jgi:integrase
MAQAGVPFPVIARYLGHTNSRTTEQIYAHHNPDYLDTAVKSFESRGKK